MKDIKNMIIDISHSVSKLTDTVEMLKEENAMLRDIDDIVESESSNFGIQMLQCAAYDIEMK